MIYLLHFDKQLQHARHYVGYTSSFKSLRQRLEQHRAGNAARITQVLKERGIGFVLAGVWEGDRSVERRLHRRGKRRWCPICSPYYNPQMQRLQCDII